MKKAGISSTVVQSCTELTKGRRSIVSRLVPPVRDTVVDIRTSLPSSHDVSLTNNTISETTTRVPSIVNTVDVEAQKIYNRVTSFDSTIDKALGTYNKTQKKMSNFGRPNKKFSFIRTPSFDNVLLPVLKSGYLSLEESQTLGSVHQLYAHLYITIHRSIDIDFSTLFHADPEWESQTAIPFAKKMKLLACSIYFNFNIPQMIRYLGGQYTGDDRDVPTILNNIRHIIPADTLSHIERILTTGAPAEFMGESSVENFLDYWRYGNHKSVEHNKLKIEKVMNKEDKHRYLIPLPCWIARFIPNLHITPQGLIIKPDKNDRLVFDASHLIKFYSICSNMMTTPSVEHPIEYGDAFTRYLTWIYNMRISLPNEDILQFSDDVSGAFRWPRLHPWIATAFSFLFFGTLYIPTGQVFGSNTSAQNFEPIAKARTLVAKHIFNNEDCEALVRKHALLIDQVKFDPIEDLPSESFVKAKPCSKHKGIYKSNGLRLPQPFIMFVDDLLLADTRLFMKLCMAASLESLYRVMGPDLPELRRSNVSIEKYLQLMVSHKQVQLGLEVDTRKMVVYLPDSKKQPLIQLLKHWHHQRRSFVIKEASSLLGKLNYAAEVAPWARFLFMAIRSSLLHCMRRNRKLIMSRPQFKQAIADANDVSDDSISVLRRKFALSKLAKAIWNSKAKCFINKSLREEINLLIQIIQDQSIKWSHSIAHMIPRTPDFQAWGDASLHAAGGYSIDLQFYWYLTWPESIQSKTLKFFKRKAKYNGEIISINLLEYVVIIINYAICSFIYKSKQLGHTFKYQSLLNWSDNRSAISWTKQAAISSAGGKALSRIFCSLCINNDLQCVSDYINTKENTIADDISRVKNNLCESSLKKLFQDHVALRSCGRFHLNPDFVSCLTHAVLSGQSPPLQQLPDCKL